VAHPIFVDRDLERGHLRVDIDAPAGNAIPLLIGTIIYAVLGVVGCVVSRVTAMKGLHNSERDISVLCAVGAFCMWLLWAMVWLMQWHPLIRPITSAEGS